VVLDLMHAAYERAGLPIGAHLDLTWRCPLRCKHCYVQRCDPQRGRSRFASGAACSERSRGAGGAATEASVAADPCEAELSTAQVFDLLEQMRSLQVLALAVSGGEIFVRKDLLRILERARELHFRLLLKTSGTVGSKALWKQVVAIHPGLVDISLYSHVPEIHDAVTGMGGSFRKSLATILMLQDAGITVDVVATLLRGYAEDPDALRSGLERLGVRSVHFNTVSDAMCEGKDVRGLFVDAEALARQVAAEALARRGAAKAPARRAATEGTAGAVPTARKTTDPVCSAGFNRFSVTPSGDVLPCVRIPEVAGNVLKTPLADVWWRSEVLNRYRSYRWGQLDQGRCVACPDSPHCPFCFGISLSDTGDPLKRSDEICRLAAATREAWERSSANDRPKLGPPPQAGPGTPPAKPRGGDKGGVDE